MCKITGKIGRMEKYSYKYFSSRGGESDKKNGVDKGNEQEEGIIMDKDKSNEVPAARYPSIYCLFFSNAPCCFFFSRSGHWDTTNNKYEEYEENTASILKFSQEESCYDNSD